MGRERAFTAKVVMLRGKPIDQAETIGIGDGQSLSTYPRSSMPSRRTAACISWQSNSCPSSAHNQVGESMERLAVCSALITLLFLISWPSAYAGGQHGFSIKVFTSPDDQFWANSVIIEGTREVMLVDAHLTKTYAETVLQEIRETKKPLSIIYITHEHADHFLGLEVFKEAYPGVRIIANSAVTDRINKVYQEKVDKWKN